MPANDLSKKLTFKEIPVPSLSPMNTLLTSFKAEQFFSAFKDSADTAVTICPLISCRAYSNILLPTKTFMHVINEKGY